jgi:molybdate transport system ATP-binding protein
MTAPSANLVFRATKMLHTAHGPQLFDVAFEMPLGKLMAIYGPSGAGKTTILRILAGLTPAGSGHIRMSGETWLDTEHSIDLPTRHRSIGFVFQDFALFPHLTVRQQLEFALPHKNDHALVSELLHLMELEELQHRRPALLSGGQQQRIAIARAIARRPRLLLLDEPLSALDEEMRRKLQDYLVRVQQHYRLTIVLVSHYLPEIHRLADTVISIDNGRIVRQGRPAEVFAGNPNNTPFRITGTVLDIALAGNDIPPAGPIASTNVFLVRVSCGDAIIPLTISSGQAESLRPGDKVIVSSDLFAPELLAKI